MIPQSPQKSRTVLATVLTALALTVPLGVMAPTATAAGAEHHVDCSATSNGTGSEA